MYKLWVNDISCFIPDGYLHSPTFLLLFFFAGLRVPLAHFSSVAPNLGLSERCL